jgi:hypothetical protein
MTEIVLTKLYELQDSTIEHKLPNWNGDISYFIEAAGDIYRELCQDPADFGGYIGEKRTKLLKFIELDEDRIKDIKDTIKNHSDWFEQLDKYMVAVDDLSAATEIAKLGEHEKAKVYGKDIFRDRKELMQASLEVILAICLYAEDKFPKETAERVIKYADELFIVK